ncbi:MAG: DNA-processing protein DprA [bacterium]
MEDLKYLIALNCVPMLGSARIRSLMNYFGCARNIFKAGEDEIIKVPKIGPGHAGNILSIDVHEISRNQIKTAEKLGAELIPFDHSDYPAALKKLFSPPVILYCLGKVDILKTSGIAIVGSRRPSGYGREVTSYFAHAIAESGQTIISGMARGVDSISHKAALKAGADTIAVLGCGLDIVYPPENQDLMQQIIKQGAVVTEYPFSTPPDPCNFPRRNRIISALSRAVLVTEAGERSGALLTAEYAAAQKKMLFAVPSNINSRNAWGSNRLLRKGARAVTNPQEVLRDLALEAGPASMECKSPELPGKENTVYKSLSLNPQHIDDISSKTRLSTSEALALLLSMELKGVVRQYHGKQFAKIQNAI